MDEKELQEFSLEDIINEFSDRPPQEETPAQEESVPEEPVVQETPEEPEQPQQPQGLLSADTIRMDAIRDVNEQNKGQVRGAVKIEDEEEPEQPEPKEAFSEGWEPEYEQPMGEYVPAQPIIFHPRSRLRELKRKLVAGPEKRYYDLSEMGLGKLQAAIFVSVLVVVLCACATAMYATGAVQENRLRLMVFSQFLAMLISALLGSNQLIEGATDMLRKRFSLNSLLVFTLIACVADGVLCLQQLRVPCCAAFSLSMTMSLWNAYERRNTEMGQMDTMRKANHLDGIAACPDYFEGRKGFLRTEGQVEDFMDTYNAPAKPEKTIGIYALVALLVSIGIGVTAGVLQGVSAGVQVLAVCLLAAMPASAFVAVSRPMAVLERRMHNLGTVLCGWQGVEGLAGKAVFPLQYDDLFPAGTTKMNGVKFFGSREPDEIVAYCTAVICAHGSGLAPLFTQVLESRNGRHYDAEALCIYDGGIGALVDSESVLVGSLSFLKSMDVQVPEGIRVSNAVCVAVDGEFSGLFAVTYEKEKYAAAGLTTLCGYRGLKPVFYTGDFVLTQNFIRTKFGANPRRFQIPEAEQREALREKTLPEDSKTLLLVTTEGLAPFAYGVTGARALRTASRLGVGIHMAGGILGLAIMLVLTLLGALQLLTPANMFLYQLVWMIPGLLITEWTRTI